VQTLRQLTVDTAVKLTTARYYTPNGRAIQAKGIVPDLLVDETSEGDVLNALRVREADLDKHLSNGKEEAPVNRRDELEEEQALIALAKKQKPVEFGGKDDFQLAQALNHFKGLPVKLAKAEVQHPPLADVKPDTKPAQVPKLDDKAAAAKK